MAAVRRPGGSLLPQEGDGGVRPIGRGNGSHADGWADAPPISLLVLPKEKRAVHGPKRKNALVALRCSGSPRCTGVGVRWCLRVCEDWPTGAAWCGADLTVDSRGAGAEVNGVARTHLTSSSFRAFRFATRYPGNRGSVHHTGPKAFRFPVGADALIGPLHRLLRGAASGSEKSRKSMRRPPQRGRHHLPRDGSHRNRRR